MIQNQITVYCEAVRSAILATATAWLLVLFPSILRNIPQHQIFHSTGVTSFISVYFCRIRTWCLWK